MSNQSTQNIVGVYFEETILNLLKEIHHKKVEEEEVKIKEEENHNNSNNNNDNNNEELKENFEEIKQKDFVNEEENSKDEERLNHDNNNNNNLNNDEDDNNNNNKTKVEEEIKHEAKVVHENDHHSLIINFSKILYSLAKEISFNKLVDNAVIYSSHFDNDDQVLNAHLTEIGYTHTNSQDCDSSDNIVSKILFWLWDNSRFIQPSGSKRPCVVIVCDSPVHFSFFKKLKDRGVYVVIVADFLKIQTKDDDITSVCNAYIELNDVIDRANRLKSDFESSNESNILSQFVKFSSAADAITVNTSQQRSIETSQNDLVNKPPPAIETEKPPSLPVTPVSTTSGPINIPSGIPATWTEHLQQQKQLGVKPGPSLPSLTAKNDNQQHLQQHNNQQLQQQQQQINHHHQHHQNQQHIPPSTTPTNSLNVANNNNNNVNANNIFYDNHGKPVMSNRPPTQYPPPPGYGQPQQSPHQLQSQQPQPHEIPSPSSIDIAASGGFWSTLQKQPMQRWGGEESSGNQVTTETLTKEQRVLHDDLVTAIYAYNVNAAVSTLRKMYTKQTRTFRIPTVLGVLLPDTAAMIVDGRTDLLNVAVCFALDSIQWCFGVQKGENIESFKYKMNANIARWILHETVKKGIPTTPTPVIQEATISVVNHILENVVELEFAWEMLTTLNISHPIQRIVPHVLAWRGYPNPSIEARVNEFLYDHPEIGSIIPPSNPNSNIHMPPQPPINFRPGSGPVSPTSANNIPGTDRTSQMVQAFLRDQQIHHPGMDYPINSHISNQNQNLQPPLPPDATDDPMLDRKFMKMMGGGGGGRPQPNDLGPRISPLYRDEYNDPLRMRGMDGPNPADKMFRLKPGNPTPPNAQNNPRGRFPGDNAAPHMDYPLSHNDDFSQIHHHHAYPNPPRVEDAYARVQIPVMQLHQPTPRDFPTRGGSFQSGKDLHHFDQDYHDGIPLESDDYLGSLARGAEDDRSYMFGQQNFDFTLTKES